MTAQNEGFTSRIDNMPDELMKCLPELPPAAMTECNSVINNSNSFNRELLSTPRDYIFISSNSLTIQPDL
ncbi:MAG: hypothetical protein Q8941_20905 [Bacteroidota bacterium]|nr:hypothetical protein [Bacteroidota bacterium]